jgi:hypothetical protein
MSLRDPQSEIQKMTRKKIRNKTWPRREHTPEDPKEKEVRRKRVKRAGKAEVKSKNKNKHFHNLRVQI